jgi:glycosyltransferase involved in cell wall biosynthesis
MSDLHGDCAIDAVGPRGAASLVVVAPLYPAVSETFVYREVVGLRARGWAVHPVSLHALGSRGARAESIEAAELTLSGRHLPATLVLAFREFLSHPTRSIRTLVIAARDACRPGENLGALARIKVVSLAVLGVGAAAWMRRKAVGHIHCHFANGPTTLGMYAALQLGIPFSIVGHANDLFDRRSLLRRKLERAAFVSCISRWHRDWYRTLCPGDDTKYPIVRCGVALDAWRPGPEVPDPRDGPLRVLTVARLVEKKGVDTLLLALAEAEQECGLAWTLDIAGEGVERPLLEALASRLGCSNRVTFHGMIDNDRVRQLMSEAQVLVLPCRTNRLGDRDGIPVVLVEAMAMGLPVVAGDLPTIRELVIHDRTGVLVAPSDWTELAKQLIELARHPEKRYQLGAGGRAMVEAEFGLDLNLDRLESSIRHALGAQCVA